MAVKHKLIKERDFEEAMQREDRVRVFEGDYIVNNGGIIIRFDDDIIVIQSSVSDVTYYSRNECEFFVVRN
ncbi:MAG: hypothetical protein ACE3L7_27940 [Candidatus Pristimantibacillus sp.]